MSRNDIPTYNLKVVLIETGIAADTLRAWERRYGLPMPDRTPGGHRLYSQHDIEIIKWLMAKRDEGLSISHAVHLWNELTASGQDPLSVPVPQIVPTPGASLDTLRQAWLDACLDFSESAADQILNQAFAAHSPETVCLEVLQHGLHEIGELWYHNKATIQQEHFTTALAHRRLDALITATAPPTRSQNILIGCTPNEQHSFTALLLTLLLRRRGYKVLYLGANVPIQRFNETLHTVKPYLVILSAQQLQTANELLETAETLRSTDRRIAYGGRIFNLVPELRKHIPAHFLGKSLPEAIQSTESLLASSTPLEEVTSISKQDRDLRNAFVRNRSTIDMYTLTETIKIGILETFSTIAIRQLGNNLTSALAFGQLDALRHELDWIKGSLPEYSQAIESLDSFLEGYAKSIDRVMGEEGQPISSWLRAQVT